ncbi:3 TM domain-containing transmembrane protein [Acrasis kona]|uniref:3 TM domain-containing transmembrane protein n=1 Tax=Acrasis kona TaxID=1008807 RepID=A0AAW2ZBR4_9EUKA
MQQSQQPDAYIYTSESNVDQSVVAQYHFARKYSISILLPGLFIILATSIVVMITSAMVTKHYYEHKGNRINETTILENTNEYRALVISSPLLLLFYLLHLVAVIVGTFISPDHEALNNYAPDDMIRTTKQNLMKYLVFVLFLPLLISILLIIILLIVILASMSEKCDCDTGDNCFCFCYPTAGGYTKDDHERREQGPAPYQQMSHEQHI